MHGVPADLDLTGFHGATLEQVALAQYIMHLTFAPESVDAKELVVGVEGGWDLRDGTGSVVDQQRELSDRDCFRLHVLLGKRVIASSVNAPESFALVFESGYKLTIYDDPHYESFSIQPGDICI